MPVTSRRRLLPAFRLLLLALPVAAPGLAAAQTQPDAGSILRDIQVSPPPKLPTPAPRYVDPGGDEPVAADIAVRIRVRAFRLRGATLIPEGELLDRLRDLVGRELSLLQLKLGARRLAEHYREKGFLARVYLPPQTIEDGVVEILIVEARLGAVELGTPPPQRADAEFARRMLLASQPEGEPLRTENILHGLRVINETPGFAATAIARPGAKEGETGLLLKVEDTPLASGLVMLDNHGAATTGEERTIVSLNLNNPGGGGDQITLMVLGTSGNFFTRLGYGFPVGVDGTRISLASTDLVYRLGGQFANLNATGWARIESVAANHPARRTPTETLTLTASIDQKHFVNDANQSNTSDKFLHLLTVGASGEWRDGTETVWQGAASLSLGNADLGLNPNDLAADRTAAQAHGRFGKLAYSLSYGRKFGEKDELALKLSGQWADGNLDSAEKFSLGGEVQTAAFLEAGGVLLHKDPWNGWDGGSAGKRNRYTLNGVGLSATWKQPGKFVMTAGWAMRMGSNPGADAKGLDNDGRRLGHRWWWQLTRLF